MENKNRTYLLSNISLPINASFEEAFSVAKKRLRLIGLDSRALKFSVYRRSTDARKRNDIKFVYSIAVSGDLPSVDSLGLSDVTELTEAMPERLYGAEKRKAPIVIVGSGPAGLFAGLFLAENGFNPIIIEQGGSVRERKKALEAFQTTRILDSRTNIQFGAGGAGTFSDGKLVTRINDPFSGYCMKKFVEFGAPAEILYLARPHIGTDVLSVVIENMIERIESLGGKVFFHTKLIDVISSSGVVKEIITDKGRMPVSSLILALGHSSRDTQRMLIARDFNIEGKQFSVGMRIEHIADDIDRALYGDEWKNEKLGRAEYNLSHNTKQRGVYTFCMCPGGVVVPAASEQGGVVVNGMSYHARDGKNSNCAVVCSVFKEDYGSRADLAIDFQERIERKCFTLGGEDYSAPIVLVGDYLNGICKNEPKRILPTYMDGGVKLASPDEYLPEFVNKEIRGALLAFDKRIPGFAASDAVLTGAETRTSSPIRITRINETGLALGFNNVYPIGEGAGYAGGITSAAIDGLRAAIKITSRYKS